MTSKNVRLRSVSSSDPLRDDVIAAAAATKAPVSTGYSSGTAPFSEEYGECPSATPPRSR